jgi:hypothetical protein
MSLSRFIFVSSLMAGMLPFAVCQAATSESAHAHHDDAGIRVPASLAVRKELAPPPAGVTELKFRDMFKMPVGPKGLEPSAKLLALDGKRVRIVGFMVQQSPLPKGGFLLSSVPVMVGDEDESLADDLPPTTLRIDLDKSRDLSVPILPGLLQLTGTLHVGMRAEPASGRSTPAQLVLDEAPQRTLRNLARDLAAKSHKRI